MNLSIKKPLASIILIFLISTFIFSIQSLYATSYAEGDNGGGVGNPLNYKTKYDSVVNILQGSGYAYAHGEQISGFLGEAWAWFWLANSWTCKTSGTYEIVMQWRYNGEATLENYEFPLSRGSSSAKGLIYLFVESPDEISEIPKSTEIIFSEYLNDVSREETYSIDGTTELRYKGYFEKGATYRLRGELEVIVFSRWIDGVTWGSSTINVRGWLGKITILPDKYSVATSITPTGSGYVTGGGTYSTGDTCTLRANAYVGYEFDHWGGGLSGSYYLKTFTVMKDVNAIAYFKKQEPSRFTVSVSVNPYGSGYVTGGGTYSTGDTCELIAYTYGEYEFDYWGGDISGKDNPNDFIVNEDTNVIAYYKKRESIDFSIEELSSDDTKYDIEETVKLYARIKSTGTKEIFPYQAEASFKVVTPSGKHEDADIDYNTATLAKGDVELLEGSWRVPNSAETGCYDIKVTIKVQNGPAKSDETSGAFCLDICHPPELTLFTPKIDSLTVKINGVTKPGCPSASNTRIHWNWGDGYEGYSRFPASHTYESAGTYMISVTSYQSDGQFTKESVTVTVDSVGQLDVQILAPPITVTSLPINFTVRITSKGQPVSGAEVTFFQISPSSRFIGNAYSGSDGLASYISFQQAELGTAVNWFAVAKKNGYQDGISLNAAFTYQPCIQLEVQILAPESVVTSTPINFTVKVTCGGQPVSGAIVDFYQDIPSSEPIELGVMTDHNGTASHTGFTGELPSDYHITWHAIAKKWGYQDGRANGELVHQP